MMKAQWYKLNEKFSQVTPREMWLIILSGIVVCVMVPFMLFVDKNLIEIDKAQKSINKLSRETKDLNLIVKELSAAVDANANIKLKSEIIQYEQRLVKLDEDLFSLTSELINPIAMRSALLSLLKLQKGVSLSSFEVLPAINMIKSESAVTDKEDDNLENNDDKVFKLKALYQHPISITLNGEYFKLRDYLKQLEDLPWTFYWQQFNYKLIEYPISELRFEIYTISTEKEFVGV